MTLHCLYHPVDTPAAQRLLAQLGEGDAVLLLSEAVGLAQTAHPALLEWLDTGVGLYALLEDLQAYGIVQPHAAIEAIDYARWVTLSEQYATQILWR